MLTVFLWLYIFFYISADGVEYVVETGKKVYHKVASDSKEDLTEAPGDNHNRNLNMDAEWLPWKFCYLVNFISC